MACLVPIMHPGAICSPYTLGYTLKEKGTIIHWTRPLSSISKWPSSGVHVCLLLALLAVNRGQHGHTDWICSCAALYTTNSDELCIYTPVYQNQLDFWIRPHWSAFIPHLHLDNKVRCPKQKKSVFNCFGVFSGLTFSPLFHCKYVKRSQLL